jgi:hypothetical protein
MDINKIRKIVINLKKRPDRLEKFDQEMNYFGWDYEICEGEKDYPEKITANL